MGNTSNKGVYCLIIKLFRKCNIKIGCLGTFSFPVGFYVYVGSAQTNLERRIERHLRKTKAFHWHIDYFLQHGQVICVHKYAGRKNMECILSHKISNMKNAIIPAKGFGSSDCSCISHLYFFQSNPDARIAKLMTKMHRKAINSLKKSSHPASTCHIGIVKTVHST